VSRGWHWRAAFGWAIALVLAASAAGAEAPSPDPLRVGVTLHPYYSWTANAVRDCGVEVIPILPGEVDAGDYQPRPEDIAKIAGLDAVVVNGVGHDDFIFNMIRASGNGTSSRLIDSQGWTAGTHVPQHSSGFLLVRAMC
jgi:zinc transport system substrate-binding protein